MTTQPESKLSRKIMTAIRAEGYFCFKVHGSALMMTGLPDIIACVGGIFVGFETKLPSQRDNVSPRQKYIHTQIESSGGTVAVICSPQEALDIINEIIASLDS